MRKLGLLFLLFAFSGPLAAQEERSFSLPLFTEGLSTRYSANAIPDGALTDALNVTLDEDIPGVPVARNGRQKYNNTAIGNSKTVRGLWPFDASDGTKYFVAFSSGSFFKSTGDGAWTQITASTFSTTLDFDCTQALGYLWCINGEAVFRWDGTSTSTVSALPLGTLIDHFRNRIIVAGISGSKSRIRLSGELDGTDFTTGAMSTSPANIAVGGVDDGQDVTCLMGVYQDVLIIGKRDSLWGLYGFGTTDFSLRELSREVGCIDDRTVREKNNCLYWMSKRGIEKFCGASIVRISDPIRNMIDGIVATAGNGRSATDSSQSDFQAGNLTASGAGAPMSATIYPGNVVPSTWTKTLTSTSDFVANGDVSLASTTAVSGGEVVSSMSWTNSGFESSYYDLDTSTYIMPGWIYNGDGLLPVAKDYCSSYWTDSVEMAKSQCYASGNMSWTLAAQLLTNADVLISSRSDSSSDGTAYSCSQQTLPLSGTSGLVRLRFDFTYDGNGPYPLYSNLFYSTQIPSGYITYGFSYGNLGGTCIGATMKTFALDARYPIYNKTSTYTATFDTGFSTPTWGNLTISMSSNSESAIDFVVRSASSSSGSWGSWTSLTNGANPTIAQKRYLDLRANFTNSVDSKTATIEDITLNAATTGYFIGQCRNPSTNITKWGNFQCNAQANSGSFSYWVATGTSCNEVTRTTANWQSQANNAGIELDTAPYVAYRVLFSLDSATQTPTLQDCTINWTEGETRPPTASSVYRDRYYLAYTSSTASGAGNDHILVLDKNDKWTMFDHHDCYSLSLYERKLYCGSSLADGFVWRMDYGTDDGGTGFTSRIRTKAYNLGEPEKRKTYSKAYFEFAPEGDSTSSTTITARYVLDRGTETFTLNSVNLNEDPSHIPLADFPFPIESPVSSRYLQLELESSGLNQPWRMFGGKIYYQTLRKE